MKQLAFLIILICALGVAKLTNAQEVKINHDGTDGLAIETDGTLRADGAATTWDDLKVPFTQAKIGKKNTEDKPDFDFDNIGLLFPNDAEEVIYMVVQIPHKYKEGTSIHPHIHWQQSNATLPTWNMEYKWFNNNETIPGSFSSLTTNTVVFPGWSSGNLAQISSFPAILGSSGNGADGLTDSEKKISSILLVKLWRTGGPSGEDILAFEFDIHYEIDTQGSRSDFTK